MRGKEKGFLLFYDWFKYIEKMSHRDAHMLINALVRYQTDGIEPPEFSPKIRDIAGMMFDQLRRRMEASEHGKKAGRYSLSVRKPSHIVRTPPRLPPRHKTYTKTETNTNTQTETETDTETKTRPSLSQRVRQDRASAAYAWTTLADMPQARQTLSRKKRRKRRLIEDTPTARIRTYI